METPNANLQSFLTTYEGKLSSKEITAILNGLELTARLEKYAEQSLGLRPDLVETKRNTFIWSPPGAGKTFNVRNVARAANLDYVQFHGRASLNAFVMKMAKACYLRQNQDIPVWIDDCDAFFTEIQSLNFMKIVLDNDEPVISWDVNVGGQISKAEKIGDLDLVAALAHWDNGGVGIEIPVDNCRFTITTNKQLASKQDLTKNKKNIHEHAIRDRVNWRAFNITEDDAWGWMASVMISNDVFQEDGFTLDQDQLYTLLRQFKTYWPNLNANSMRTVKEAGALLFNNPKSFADEFEQNFLG
jgi:ribosomal protein L39E